MSEAVNLKVTAKDIKLMALMVIVGTTTFFGTDMHLPSLPTMVHDFHTTRGVMQSSVTIYVLGLVLMAFIYGPLSDKVGRKPVVLSGLIIAILGSLVCVFSKSIVLFLLGRFIQGVGASVGMSVGRSILADGMSREKLAAVGSFASVFISVSIMISPVIGGYLQHYFGWHSVFIALTFFFAVAFLCTLLFLPETIRQKNPDAFHPRHLMKNYFTITKSRRFWAYTIGAGAAAGTMMGYITISPFLFQGQYHLSVIVYGWLGLIAGIAGMIGKAISGVQTGITKNINTGMKTGLLGFLLIGIIACGAALLGLNTAIIMMVWVCLIMGFQGFVFANAMGGALTEFRQMGGASAAMYSGVQYGCGLITATIVSLLPFHGDGTLSALYLVLGVIGIGAFYLLHRD